ncbi:DUF2784 family protein [Aridibaculum aurantiacum]|uniref:DUF2784 family protein n=1 Tax=Aridibaculum aurantiacum TaxID=2810307 RepID=UPI001A97B1F9
MLIFLDILLTIIHLVIIGFNLFGWMWKKTQKAHLWFAGLTLGSWLILGIWYGLGYCPVTDWQWQVKRQLGESNLPNSFVKYYADKITGTDISSALIDAVTAVSFALAIMASLYVNFGRKSKRKIHVH